MGSNGREKELQWQASLEYTGKKLGLCLEVSYFYSTLVFMYALPL